MSNSKVIAIDGPAASGKSSIGLIIADRLDYMFLDTGIMYRAVTWRALREGLDISNEEQIGKVASSIKINFQNPSANDGRTKDIIIDGEDATWKLRSKEVNQNVSQVSRYAKVRDAMTEQQKIIGTKGEIVMAGRDIGTVVLPDAGVKIYLEASAEERARRRFNEDVARGRQVNYEDILQNIRLRDAIDSNRIIAPLIPAKDAHVINTDGKSIEDVVREIMQVVEAIDIG